MKDFLLLYQGGDTKWMEKSPEEIQAVMQQWGAWFKKLESTGNLRSPGAALEPAGQVLRSEGGRLATDTTMPEVKELVGGYSVIQAESIDHATELAKGSPFLENNPGGRVMVRPIISPGE